MNITMECGCGELFEAKKRSKFGLCPACTLRAKKIRQDRWREKQRIMAAPLEKALERGVRAVTVVNDPLEMGGFAEGVKFSLEEWSQMLKHLTFTPGTILKDGQGRLYEFRIGGSRCL